MSLILSYFTEDKTLQNSVMSKTSLNSVSKTSEFWCQRHYSEILMSLTLSLTQTLCRLWHSRSKETHLPGGVSYLLCSLSLAGMQFLADSTGRSQSPCLVFVISCWGNAPVLRSGTGSWVLSGWSGVCHPLSSVIRLGLRNPRKKEKERVWWHLLLALVGWHT